MIINESVIKTDNAISLNSEVHGNKFPQKFASLFNLW